MDKPNQDYDMEICGVCHGSGERELPMGNYEDSVLLDSPMPCSNCQDSPKPGYILIPKPEFRPDEMEG